MTILDKDVIESKGNKSSGKLLRNFIFSVVEEALISVYEENYSIRCLQSSLGIQRTLNKFGINSKIQVGACCFPIVSGINPYQISWGGFWDKDHHVWLISDFFEIIDFTISKLHLHPARNGKVVPYQIPALWWGPADIIPSIFRYLPDNLNTTIYPQLEGEDNEILIRYFDKLDEITITKINLLNENSEFKEFEVLTGMQKLNDMYEAGNDWLRGSLLIQESKFPFPDWIRKKENELLDNYLKKNSLQ